MNHLQTSGASTITPTQGIKQTQRTIKERFAAMKNSDTLHPFLLEQSSLRGRMVRLDNSLKTILTQHAYPAAISHVMAETVTMTTLLAGMLKFEGILTLQITGKGALTALVADITHHGHVRAYAKWNETELAANDTDTTFKQLVGENGMMVLTIDQSATKERYQGMVSLEGDTITDWMCHYFKQSEQIKTGFKMAVTQSGNSYQSAAIMMQAIPHETAGGQKSNINEDDWRRSMLLLDTAKDDELISDDLDINDVLFRLFNEDGVRVFDTLAIKHQCRCSDDKVKMILKSLSKEELESINQDGLLETTCQFCSKRYHFNVNDILAEKGE